MDTGDSAVWVSLNVTSAPLPPDNSTEIPSLAQSSDLFIEAALLVLTEALIPYSLILWWQGLMHRYKPIFSGM